MKPSILLTLTATAASTSASTLPFKFRRDTVPTDTNTPNRRLLHSPPTNTGSISGSHIKAASSINNRPQSLRAGAYLPYHPPASTPDHPTQNQDMIQSVTGSLVIPTISMPVSGPTAGNSVGEYSASLWVGIDGASATDSFTHPGSTANASCNPLAASLRAGVDIFWDGTLGGQQTPYVWAQWYPAENARGFLDFKASPGDELRFTVSTGPHGNSGGGVLVENFGPPQSPKGVDGRVKIPIATGSLIWKDMPPLCSAQASWIIEDFPLQERPELPTALGNFTDVRFSEVGVVTWLGGNFTGDEVLGKDKLKMLEIYDAGQGGTLAKCKTDGEGEKKSVVCSRVVEA